DATFGAPHPGRAEIHLADRSGGVLEGGPCGFGTGGLEDSSLEEDGFEPLVRVKRREKGRHLSRPSMPDAGLEPRQSSTRPISRRQRRYSPVAIGPSAVRPSENEQWIFATSERAAGRHFRRVPGFSVRPPPARRPVLGALAVAEAGQSDDP